MIVTLPAEEAPTDVETRWRESEPPLLLPLGQDSVWGQVRKVFCDYLQTNLFDALQTYWLNLAPETCDETDIANWEVELGIPVNPNVALASRRAFVVSRAQRGPFTKTRRRLLVEAFIKATFGQPIVFTFDGVPFTSDGIPFADEEQDVSGLYEIVEDVPGFSYDVRILSSVDLDQAGLYRELYRITPAPIDANFTISRVSSL